MNKNSPLKFAAPLALAMAPFAAGFAPGANAALDLNGIGYVQYGDAQSYSLPIACMQVGQAYSGCTYNIDSTPGQIKDLVVIYTGAGGQPVNTNFAGMDDAYSTPSGGGTADNFFQTGGLTFGGNTYGSTDPGQVTSFTGDVSNRWDTTLSALNTYLAGDAPVFFFNNNNLNSGELQTLAAWMQVAVEWVDPGTGSTVVKYFDLTNNNGKYALVSEGGGGKFLGDVTTYTNTTGAGPDGNSNTNTDYVLAGGAVCVATGGGNTPAPVPCGSLLTYDPPGIPGTQTLAQLGFTAVSSPVNHNLGADHAAYAIIFPELNLLLADLAAKGIDGVMHIDLRLGCDPTLFGTNANATSCTGTDIGWGKNINNGYEQLFLARAVQPPTVSSPGSLALMAGGLLVAGAALRRREKKAA